MKDEQIQAAFEQVKIAFDEQRSNNEKAFKHIEGFVNGIQERLSEGLQDFQAIEERLIKLEESAARTERQRMKETDIM